MMSMLTGIEASDSGDGFINGASVMWDLETARVHIGLCPQFDALMDNLTAREHLVLLACMYVCMCIYVCVYACICIYVCVYACMCIHTYNA